MSFLRTLSALAIIAPFACLALPTGCAVSTDSEPTASQPEEESIGEAQGEVVTGYACPDQTQCYDVCDEIGRVWKGRCTTGNVCICMPDIH